MLNIFSSSVFCCDGDVGDNDVAADDDDDGGGGGFNFVAFKCELGEVRGGGSNSIGGNSDKLNNSTGVHQLP